MNADLLRRWFATFIIAGLLATIVEALVTEGRKDARSPITAAALLATLSGAIGVAGGAWWRRRRADAARSATATPDEIAFERAEVTDDAGRTRIAWRLTADQTPELVFTGPDGKKRIAARVSKDGSTAFELCDPHGRPGVEAVAGRRGGSTLALLDGKKARRIEMAASDDGSLGVTLLAPSGGPPSGRSALSLRSDASGRPCVSFRTKENARIEWTLGAPDDPGAATLTLCDPHGRPRARFGEIDAGRPALVLLHRNGNAGLSLRLDAAGCPHATLASRSGVAAFEAEVGRDDRGRITLRRRDGTVLTVPEAASGPGGPAVPNTEEGA